MLSKLTIIIPTYNRQPFVRRQIQYWSDTDAQVLILDGSDTPLPENDQLQLLSNINYRHTHSSFQERLGLAAESLDTPYAILLCDDEFYLPTALESCMMELERESTLVACGGQCLQFFFNGQKLLGRQHYSMHQGYSISDQLPQERMARHLREYSPTTFYAVIKSTAMRSLLNLMRQCTFSAPTTMEIAFELGASYLGKSRMTDDLLWLRSSENAPIETNEWKRSLQFNEWHMAPQYQHEVDAYYQMIGNHFSEGHTHEAREIVQFAKTAVQEYFQSQQLVPTPTSRKILNHTKQLVWRILHPIRARAESQSQGKDFLTAVPFNDAVNDLRDKGILAPHEELIKAERAIIDFHARETSPPKGKS